MTRASSLVLLCLTLFLVLLPLGVTRPGMPATLKADEPAYYLMALSLVHDGDLLCETHDLARLWQEFPYQRARNLILATDDGWETVYFGKPFVYSLFTAPLVALFGAAGMVSANFLLLAAMIAMGASYLGRFNRGAVATLFSAGFFLVSTSFAYAFWMQPEIYNMAGVCACLYFGLHRPREGERSGWLRVLASERVRIAASGAALSLAAYNKPVLALLGLPVLLYLLRRRGFRTAALWVAGGVLVGALQMGGSALLIGHPSAYLGVARAGLAVESPDTIPKEILIPLAKKGDEVTGASNSWAWIFRLPKVDAARLTEDLGYFLWGRHVGLLPYLPFAGLAVLLFLLHGRRSRVRWSLLACLVGVAFFFFIWIHFNWHGGGGFVGNRYYVNTYPAFLFLVTRIRPRVVLPVAWALGGLLLGPILLTPYGAPVLHPTLQAHARNFPFDRLPLELTLIGGIPGYVGTTHSGVYVLGRRDQLLPMGDRLWLHGAHRSELWLTAPEPVSSFVFQARLADPTHPPTVQLGDQKYRLAPGVERQQFELRPRRPDHIRDGRAQYRLVVDSPSGRPEEYLRNEDQTDTFFLGSELTLLGPRELLERDVYSVRWIDCAGPARVTVGAEFQARAELRNTSQESWPATGGARVSLSFHWLDLDRSTVLWEGLRTPLGRDVAPGAELRRNQEITAPSVPGRYRLELEPVFEHVAWFSKRTEGATCQLEVEVVPEG